MLQGGLQGRDNEDEEDRFVQTPVKLLKDCAEAWVSWGNCLGGSLGFISPDEGVSLG